MAYEFTMPLYKSHKTVRALEISDVIGQQLVFKEEGFMPRDVPVEMFALYTPVSGDFFVVYADGYESISPRKAFLDGYMKEAT